MRTAVQILVFSALLACAVDVRADFYIVVSETSPQSSLTRTEALHLFMGRKRALANGQVVQIFDMPGEKVKRAGFYRALSGMSLAQVTSYWARLMFSGQNLPPQSLRDEAAMVEAVRSNPNAVGWLGSEPITKGLRTVLVLPEPR